MRPATTATPLVITAGQQARSILPTEPFLFSMQASELPKPYVKWSIEPARAQDVPAAIARAYYLAMQPRWRTSNSGAPRTTVLSSRGDSGSVGRTRSSTGTETKVGLLTRKA
jgi:hypothetical protein